MMNIKKIVILILGLVLPVGIFLFLKFFGENKFEVQPLFQTELPADIKDCGDLSVPYNIHEEIVAGFHPKENDINVVLVDNDLATLSRVFDQFSSDPVNIIKIDDSATMDGKSLKSCVLLLSSPNDIVLFNNQGIIYGQYSSDDRDEIDRLIIELSIILKK
jgi:hypothetical protein